MLLHTSLRVASCQTLGGVTKAVKVLVSSLANATYVGLGQLKVIYPNLVKDLTNLGSKLLPK